MEAAAASGPPELDPYCDQETTRSPLSCNICLGQVRHAVRCLSNTNTKVDVEKKVAQLAAA